MILAALGTVKLQIHNRCCYSKNAFNYEFNIQQNISSYLSIFQEKKRDRIVVIPCWHSCCLASSRPKDYNTILNGQLHGTCTSAQTEQLVNQSIIKIKKTIFFTVRKIRCRYRYQFKIYPKNGTYNFPGSGSVLEISQSTKM